MRTIIFIALTLLSINLQGQIINSGIVGSWMKINAIYNSGENLPVDNKLNQSYFRLSFGTDGKAYKQINPCDQVYSFDYSVSGNNMKIGFVNYQISYLTNDTLILIEKGKNGIDASSIKYTFVSEKIYQNNISVTPDMIIFSGKDSIFIENKSLSARFNNEISFHSFLVDNMPAAQGAQTDGYFMATFIITANGVIDSLKIHKGIEKSFDNQFIKAVNKSAKFWIPAKLKNKNVSVLHVVLYESKPNKQFGFFDSPSVYATNSKILNYRNGIFAIFQRDYNRAIESFSKFLESNPNDVDALIQRGNCYYKLNDLDKANVDWQKAKGFKNKRL
jgi:Gram-negative bacterial tonB protein.